MLTLICILLVVIALYAFGMWGFLAYRAFLIQRASSLTLHEKLSLLDRSERYTFHLGLCGIIALGFLGLILSNGAP